MILTLTDLLTEYTDNTKDDSTTNVARGTRRMNRALELIVGNGDYPWLTRTTTFTTTATTKSYVLPVSVRKITSVKVTIDNVDYIADEVADPDLFDRIDSLGTSVTSDTLAYYNIQNGYIRIYPTSATSSNVVTITYKARAIEMVFTDYVTGTVTATNGSTTVTGSGTSWSVSNMKPGGYFKVTNDNYAYEILSIDSTTQITLVKPYIGVTGGSKAYKIGDSSVIPEEYQDILWQKACADYFIKVQDETTAAIYRAQFAEIEKILKDNTMGTTTRNIIPQQRMFPKDPNFFGGTS